MGEDPHRAGPFAHDRSDVGDVEPGDRAERHRLALRGGQRRRRGRARPRARACSARRPGVPSPRRDGSPAERDRDRPAPTGRRASRRKWSIARRRATVNSHARNARFVAVEADDRRGDRGPGLRRDVLGRVAGGDPEVAQQRRLELAPDGGERRPDRPSRVRSNTVGKDVPIIEPPRSSSATVDAAGDAEHLVDVPQPAKQDRSRDAYRRGQTGRRTRRGRSPGAAASSRECGRGAPEQGPIRARRTPGPPRSARRALGRSRCRRR